MESKISASRLRTGKDLVSHEWSEILFFIERIVGMIIIDDGGNVK